MLSNEIRSNLEIDKFPFKTGNYLRIEKLLYGIKHVYLWSRSEGRIRKLYCYCHFPLLFSFIIHMFCRRHGEFFPICD